MRMNSKLALMSAVAVVAVAASSVWANCGACEGKKADGAACDVKGKCPVASAAGKDAGGTITTAGLAALLRAKTPVALFDARTGKYDDGKRVPGAKALSAASSDADIAAALPDKNALVVTYCAGLSCPASHQLADKLKGLGYANVIEYAEGIAGWTAAGNAVDQAQK